MEENNSSLKRASMLAFACAALFTVMIVMFNTVKQPLAIVFVATSFHVLLFPVVAALPSANWARAAGYGWLVVDIVASIILLNGVDEHTASAIRYGGHIPAAIWIITSSLRSNKLIMIVGVLQGVCLAAYSFAAPWAPMQMLFPAMILLIIWLVLAGLRLSKLSKEEG